MPKILKDIGHEYWQQKVSLNFLDQEKDEGKETSNISDWESLHSDGSNTEMVTQTWYEKKMMEIFATPQENKLGWFNTSNHYRSL